MTACLVVILVAASGYGVVRFINRSPACSELRESANTYYATGTFTQSFVLIWTEAANKRVAGAVRSAERRYDEFLQAKNAQQDAIESLIGGDIAYTQGVEDLRRTSIAMQETRGRFVDTLEAALRACVG